MKAIIRWFQIHILNQKYLLAISTGKIHYYTCEWYDNIKNGKRLTRKGVRKVLEEKGNSSLHSCCKDRKVKTMWEKIFIPIVLGILFGIFSVSILFLFPCRNKQEVVVAEETMEEIIIKDSITWEVINDTLFINGKGEIWSNDYYYLIQHIDCKNSIVTIVIGSDIKRIGCSTFNDYENLTSVIAFNDYIVFTECSFVNCNKLIFISVRNNVFSFENEQFRYINCKIN